MPPNIDLLTVPPQSQSCSAVPEYPNINLNTQVTRPNKKICVFPVTCFLKLGLGRLDSFLFFEIILDLPEVLFIKTELVYLHFPACHVVSRLVAPSFLLDNSLIFADVLSAALQRERYKNTFTKVSFNISCNKNRLETENIFLREESSGKKPKMTIKKLGRSVT